MQIIGFSDKATWLIPGSEGKWVTSTTAASSTRPSALRAELSARPDEPANAFNAIKTLEPKPDNIYLLTDGLPTMGEVTPDAREEYNSERIDNRAIRQLPVGVPSIRCCSRWKATRRRRRPIGSSRFARAAR